jgi:hypothetical protein
MRRQLLAAAIAAGVVADSGILAAGQQFDMAAAQKWGAAKVVRYQVSGVFKGATTITPGQNAQYAHATVGDAVTVRVDYDIRQNAIVGTPAVTNSKSSVSNLSGGSMVKCPPPVPQGDFELLDVAKVVAGPGNTVELQGTRVYPSIGLSSGWPHTCAHQTVPGKTEPVTTVLPLPSPVMLALPTNADPKFAISTDRKSFSLKVGDWTWTYTPTLVQ